MRWPSFHESFTTLVTLGVLAEAAADLDGARRRCTQAWDALTGVRERLDRVLDVGFSIGSFRPLEDLFREEKPALARYEESVIAGWQRSGLQPWPGTRVALLDDVSRQELS